MLETIDPLVIGQMALGALADLAFSVAFGAFCLGFGGARGRRAVCLALLVWLLAQALDLPAEAATMSGSSVVAALPAIPLVLLHSHFGLMWMIGAGAGVLSLALATNRSSIEPGIGRGPWRILLYLTMIVMAFTHAGTTHAADAGDFSTPELVHWIHLLATAGWAGVVVCAAFPLRRSLAISANDALSNMSRLSRVATLTFAVAIVTGLANAYRGLGGSLTPLTHSLWGALLIAKLVLVTAAVAIGATNRLVYMRHFAGGDRRARAAFMGWLTLEACLMIGVLIAAAVLGHSIPGGSV